MRNLVFSGLLLWSTTMSALADGEPSGDFDYYVLALSWSPSWCALEGDARSAAQCAPDRALGWVVHGLWPQYEQGWPSYCNSSKRAPSRGMTNAQADLFGSGGAAWYQWKKHGVCAGLEPEDYYALVREAYQKVVRPEVFRKLLKPVRLPASVVEQAFLKANPQWQPDMLTITCKSDRIQEARLCLTRDLEPRPCTGRMVRDCTNGRALFDPVK